MLAIVPVELGLIAVDLMLGGTGRAGATERGLTAIDADLLAALAVPSCDALGDVLGETLGSPTPLAATVGRATTDLATIEVEDVKALFAELETRGAPFAQRLTKQAWGGLDFHVRDLDGNVLSFVQDREETRSVSET